MPVGHYLQDKLRIAKLPPSQWIAALEALPAEKQPEVEAYLKTMAEIIRYRRELARAKDKHG